MKLIHDLPENKGIENGIKRAKQMTSFRFTPVGSLPAVQYYYDMEKQKQYAGMRLVPWQPQKGMIYSSVLANQKFVGFNVSFETFVTALSDPDSVLYKYNVDGQGRKNANCWYGIVCSCFVSYVLDMDERRICRNWPEVRNVTLLGQPELNELRLLDIVLNTKTHIAVITDILRDENGNTAMIEVSESTLPFCKATYFTPDEFRGYWYGRGFDIYRKSDISLISYTPSPFVRISAEPDRGIEEDPLLPDYVPNPDILPDQGNHSNYKKDQEIVLDILRDGWQYAEIRSESGETELLEVINGKAVVPLNSPMHSPGTYQVRAVSADRKRFSMFSGYTVTGLEIAASDSSLNSSDAGTPAVIAPGSRLELSFENACPDPVKNIFIHAVSNSGERAHFAVGAGDPKRGTVTVSFPDTEEDFFVFINAGNTNGEYTSNYLYFRTKA